MSTTAAAVTPKASELEAALAELQSLVSADGIVLALHWDEGEGAEVEVNLDAVECADCVLPAGQLRDVLSSSLRRRVPGDYAVTVHDPRTNVRKRASSTILVMDPTVRPETADVVPVPDAGPLAGQTVGFRVDILWRSWDWVAEEWSSLLSEAGVTATFYRRAQGVAGAEGVAHQKAYEDFVDAASVAMVGMGNCGSCTSWTIKDAVTAMNAGKATVAIVTEQFEGLGRTLASQYGRPDLRFLVLPYPFDTLPESEVRSIARRLLPDALAALGATV